MRADPNSLYERAVNQAREQILLDALAKAAGRVDRAADLLGISRRQLHYLIVQLRLAGQVAAYRARATMQEVADECKKLQIANPAESLGNPRSADLTTQKVADRGSGRIR